jgi:acyl-CoA reductase-like NAD-dependent aldehyde dehydrogenase
VLISSGLAVRELALASSRKAFLSWSTMLARDRRDIVERAVQLLEERKEEFKEAYQHDTYASDLVVHADFTRTSSFSGVVRKEDHAAASKLNLILRSTCRGYSSD